MEAQLIALENRLMQTERALVVERLARQTVEVAQQTVETWPAGVDSEDTGTLLMFSGDFDLSERTYLIPWSHWSFTIRSHFGKFNRTTAWMLQQVETRVEDPIITDSTAMTRAEQTVLGTGVLCVCSDLQEQGAAGGPTNSQRFRVLGMKAAAQRVRATSSSEVPTNVPSPLVANEVR